MPKKTSKTTTKKAPKQKQAQAPSAESAARKTLPGYVRFTAEVWQHVWGHRNLYGRVVLISLAALMLISLTTEQAQYASLSEATHEAVTTLPEGASRTLAATGVLFSSLLSGTLTSSLSDTQYMLRVVVLLFVWLVTVWLMRHLLAGSQVTVRDGLYNAGAPLVSTLLVGLFGLLQLLPFALALTLFAGLLSTGVLAQALLALVVGVVSIALGVVTLYWLSGTLFAAIIVTIPGTYPVAALRSARQVVAGYRASLLLRLLWLGLSGLVVATIIILPLVFIDAALGISSSFLTALIIQLLSVGFVLYGSAYVYLLYRKVIDERSDQ